MNQLTDREMATLVGGGEGFVTMCGLTTGIAFAATVYFGVVGFALTANKAIAACTLAFFL